MERLWRKRWNYQQHIQPVRKESPSVEPISHHWFPPMGIFMHIHQTTQTYQANERQITLSASDVKECFHKKGASWQDKYKYNTNPNANTNTNTNTNTKKMFPQKGSKLGGHRRYVSTKLFLQFAVSRKCHCKLAFCYFCIPWWTWWRTLWRTWCWT